MNKLLKYALQMGVAFVLVWTFVVMIFTDEVIFGQPDSTPSEEVAVDGIDDGTYVGTGEGYGGEIEVEVTVENGVITEVTVLNHDETEGVSDPAFAEVPDAIVENNSADVDVASGATFSSEGIMEAVNNALGTEDSGDSDADDNDAAEDASYEDGTYTATVDGHNGPLEVEVVVEGGAIADVTVLSHEETENLSDPAISDVPAAIVENNSTDVDTISGATVTSEAIIEAVNTALEEAAQ